MDDEERKEAEIGSAREALAAIPPGFSLVTALLEVQDRVGYLPRHVMEEVAAVLGVTPSTVYSVASFYNQFRFTHPGKCSIQVCTGTACHVKRARVVMDSFERKLGIGDGEVTADREYGLSSVRCVGCCALAPVVVVDGQVMADMSPSKVDGFFLVRGIGRPEGGGEAG